MGSCVVVLMAAVDGSSSSGPSTGTSSARLQHVSAHLSHQTSAPTAARTCAPAAAAGAQNQRRPNGYGTDTRVCDLLIAKGRVIDPLNGVDAVLDVAVRFSRSLELARSLCVCLSLLPSDSVHALRCVGVKLSRWAKTSTGAQLRQCSTLAGSS